MTRENGFYWVRDQHDGWHVARYDNGRWFITGWDNAVHETYFDAIDERRLTHD